jgi:hypothetical protein
MAIVAGQPILAADLVNNINYYGTDTGSANAYAIAPTPAVTAYAAGQHFVFKAAHTNTGASTLNVSSLGTVAIKKGTAVVDVVAGDITAGEMIEVIYDGTYMQLVTPVPIAYSNGLSTASSGTQTIAHGLGKIPKKVKLTGSYWVNSSGLHMYLSIGAYDGTHQTNVWEEWDTNVSTGLPSYNQGTSTSYTINLAGATGVVTVDATNITITWTGSPSGSILWEAEG